MVPEDFKDTRKPLERQIKISFELIFEILKARRSLWWAFRRKFKSRGFLDLKGENRGSNFY
jgi:hypothetical protein